MSDQNTTTSEVDVSTSSKHSKPSVRSGSGSKLSRNSKSSVQRQVQFRDPPIRALGTCEPPPAYRSRFRVNSPAREANAAKNKQALAASQGTVSPTEDAVTTSHKNPVEASDTILKRSEFDIKSDRDAELHGPLVGTRLAATYHASPYSFDLQHPTCPRRHVPVGKVLEADEVGRFFQLG